MRGKISDIDYINEIKDNVLSVNRKVLSRLYEELRLSDCIITYGSGRSLCSATIGTSQMAKMKRNSKIIISPEDPGFPGSGMLDAAPELEKRYNKIFLLLNSGGGRSEDPMEVCKGLDQYIEATNSEKFSMGLITSNPNSPMARIVRKHGHVIKLRGRKMREVSNEYRKTGIMGDIFELGGLSLIHMMAETLYKDGSADTILELLEEEFPKMGARLDEVVESEVYTSAINILERHNDVFLGGRGTSDEVAKMSVIRLAHVKTPLGDHVYKARGENTPRPRPGDFEILISYSGVTGSVLRWCSDFRRENGIVLSIVGNHDTPLVKNSNYSIVLDEEVEPGHPRRFYMRAAFILSPLPVKLIERLSERGLFLPEYILHYYHSIIE